MVRSCRRDAEFVQGSGVRPPHLSRNSEIAPSDVKWFLTKYDEYAERMRMSNLHGMERSVASIRELFTTDFVELLQEVYVDETKELTGDAALWIALKCTHMKLDVKRRRSQRYPYYWCEQGSYKWSRKGTTRGSGIA